MAPRPAGSILFACGVFIALLYAFTWLWMRPRQFLVTPEALQVEWPIRARAIPRASLGEAAVITTRDFRAEYGWGMRFGAGGLWGGFGLLLTRRGPLAMYVSRLSGLVLVPIENDRTLLITPRDPEAFVAALGAGNEGSPPRA